VADEPRWGAVYVTGLIALMAALVYQSGFFGLQSFAGYVHSFTYLRGRARWVGLTCTATLAAYGQVGSRPVALTGDNDNIAHIWDLTTHRQIGQPLTGHRKAVTAVTFGLLGDQPIAITGSGTGDSTVRAWHLSPSGPTPSP
jgi:WD40 repeat protein